MENKWKIAFFALLAMIVIAFVVITYSIFSPTEQEELKVGSIENSAGSVLQVQTTTKEFEAIAQKYLGDAIKNSPIAVDIAVDEQIYLFSELVLFGVPIPIQMDFDPIADGGNIRLKQTEVHVGKLNVPPSSVLKLLKDSVDFPSWIIVRPNDEEIFIDLSRLNIANGNRVRAKEIDLKNDKIQLEIIVKTK